ncbi:single-stranded DNA-binding protein [Acidithiobacillus thiooxidans]|uniref:single-stranded DNA-binding protein n=1 Tax=Acidithiobacillus thiooxidans TaxID=930 RepID=UPI001C06A12D|nr:single-stranded DNA-binding protein [Acidithiobacillus thiooxidans]MBU2753067.1 single-stranded DNA-binding protein [Acidithiobacillus thiooxidans]
MAGVNKVIILGHLGKDPEMRYMPDGKAIANFNVATSENFKDREGNKQERTEWHRVVLFGRVAEIAGEYLRKGSMAFVEGKLQTRKWTDKEGQERYTTEIVGDRLQLVGPRNDGGANSGNDRQPQQQRANNAPSNNRSSQPPEDPFGGGNTGNTNYSEFDDDIPF